MSSSLIRRFVGKRRAEAGIHLADQDNDLVVIESAEAAAKHDFEMIWSRGEPCQ